MNRSALIEFVQRGMGKDASRVAADRAVSLVIEGIKVGLQRDKSVQLVGFGTFKVVERKARLGINPKTLEPSEDQPVAHRQAGGRQRPQKRDLITRRQRTLPPRHRENPFRPARNGFSYAPVRSPMEMHQPDDPDHDQVKGDDEVQPVWAGSGSARPPRARALPDTTR